MAIYIPRSARPSWENGFARSRGESANPGLWDGLIGAWMTSLGHTGAVIHDVARGKYNGDVNGVLDDRLVIRDGKKSLYYDTTSDHLNVGDLADYGHFTNLSISLWVIFDISSRDQDIVVTPSHSGTASLLMWNDYAGVTKYSAIITDSGGTGSGTKISTSTPIVGSWQHLVVTFEPELYRLWINGVEDASSPFTMTGVDNVRNDSGDNMFFGKAGAATNKTLDGNLADILIYNRTIPQSIVQQLYNDSLYPFRLKPLTIAVPPAVVAGGETFTSLISRRRKQRSTLLRM